MNRFLSAGEKILVLSYDKKIEFIIEEVIGVGGSCIAYKVKYFENENIPHLGILKEYCPAFLDDGTFSREGTSLNISENMKEKFLEGLCEFKRTYKSINEYLSSNFSASNYHTVQIGLYEGNNTAYTLTSCDYGMSYDKIDNENLLSICKTMLSVTKAVELYHNAGFLHLDIKPKNILVLNDVADLIKLFDFDSLTSIERLKRREIYGVPVPEDYYVPELQNYDIRNIGIETDIFEIGAMLFFKAFKRAPEVSDMSHDSKYDLDRNELFIGVSPQAKKEFVELLKKTIQISKRSRYKTTKDLKTKLEKIISLISEEKPYLLDLPKWQPSKNCVGRKNEIKEIKRRLDEDGYVFVKGIGGLGKSEIAKLFAENYKNEYHTVQFCKFSDSLKSVVATMPINGIDEQNYGNAEELVKEKNKVLHLADDKTLIIVDNFNVTYDDFLRDFLPSDNKSFRVIFTTRCTMAAEYYESKTYDLPKLSMDECKVLFFSHLATSSNGEEEVIEELIKFVDYNTLIIVLMAITIRKSGFTLNEMLSNLKEQKIDRVETEIFHEYDFSSDEVNAYNKIYAHLSTIFSICGLTEINKEVLKNATLISLNGIGLDEFIKQCDSCNINQNSVDDVVDMGWLNKDSNDIISMHPIISDMFSTNEELYKKESYYKFAEYLEDFCNPDYCHFSIVLNKLACAKHLERRYTFESDEKKVIITTKLGRMYENIYQPNEARKHLKRALALAKDLGLDAEVIYIYSFLGSVEKDFGTYRKAIDYYQKCIFEGKKLKNRFYYVVVESMIAISDCHENNNDKIKAYNSYLEALNYSKCFKLYEYIPHIADRLIKLCEELEWKEKEQIYRRVLSKYGSFDEPTEENIEFDEFSKKSEEGDYEGSLIAYEKILSSQIEELGEDSPVYKDLKRILWGFYAINKQKEQALHLLSENFAFVESTYGENSMEMARELSSASNIMLELTEFESAERFSKRAIEICEDYDAQDEYSYVEAVFALARLYLVQGKHEAASTLVKKIDFSRFSGNDFLSDIITACGMVMCQLSKFDEVEPLCQEVLNKNGIEDKDKYLSYIILAIIYEQKGKFDEAERYANSAKNSISSLKTEHIKKEWLVAYYRSIARIKLRKGNSQEAISILSNFIDSFNEEEKDTLFYLNGVYSDRGLFYFYCDDIENATADFNKCEEILVKNNLPDDAFAVLYNNIAMNYEKTGHYAEAKKYLKKIVNVNKNVLKPKSYFEAIVCSNIGWVDYNLGNIEHGLCLLKNAVIALENLGITDTTDYFKMKNNIAIVYVSQEKYLNSFNEYSDIRSRYDPTTDFNGEMSIKTNFGIVFSLLKLGRAEDAYDFSLEELKRFEAWFGKTSPIRIKAILQMGGLFREFGYSDCYDFFFLADELMDESKDFNSLNNAKLLNYIGLYFTDEKKEHGFAKLKFEESKQLFEELNATDDEMYPIVVKNIEYVRDLIMDDLIGKMAQSLIDETQED